MSAIISSQPIAPIAGSNGPQCGSTTTGVRTSVVLLANRRRNALVPLPLLPPVPKNTIVTSVKIVHNTNPSPPESPSTDSDQNSLASIRSREDAVVTIVSDGEKVKSPPISPTQTSFYFSPTSSNKRARQRRRSCTPRSPPTSPTGTRGVPPHMNQAPGPTGAASSGLDVNRKEETKSSDGPDVMVVDNATVAIAPVLKHRRPRSTIVVTVRLANPPQAPMETSTELGSHPSNPPPTAPVLSTPRPRHQSLSLKKSKLINLQSRSNTDMAQTSLSNGAQRANSPPPAPPVPVKPKWNKPRVSSGLATAEPIVAGSVEEEEDVKEDEILMENELPSLPVCPRRSSPPRIYSASSPNGILKPAAVLSRPIMSKPTRTKKGKVSKTGSRTAMLRWAVLNHSGPEVGRRILAMGVRLALEIWEAEQTFDGEEMMLEQGYMRMEGAIVEEKVHDEESLRMERERIAEECIRELEEMEVDLDGDEEMIDDESIEKADDTVQEVASSLDAMEDVQAVETKDDTPVQSATQEATSAVPEPVSNTSDETIMLDLSAALAIAMEVDTPQHAPKPQPTPTQALSRSQRRLSFPKRASLRGSLDIEPFSKTAFNANMGRRRSLVEDKLPMVIAARKWFEKMAQ